MRHLVSTVLMTLALLPMHAAGQSPVERGHQGATPAMEKRPWVGVSVSSAPAALRHQLKLAEGLGLIVEFVQARSPAADAGIKPFDLLLKLDDQWLVNPEQFSVLIRMHRAGDEVKLSLIREGGERVVTAKLVDHEFSQAPAWETDAPWVFAPIPGPAPRSPPGEHGSSRSLTWMDGHRQASVTTTDDHTGLVVKDIDTGRVLFDGPIDTEEQRKNLPLDVRRLLDSLVKISTAFGAPAGGDKPPPVRKDAQQQP